jgi:hypothetical protein
LRKLFFKCLREEKEPILDDYFDEDFFKRLNTIFSNESAKPLDFKLKPSQALEQARFLLKKSVNEI